MDTKQILKVMESDVNKSLAALNAATADLMNSTYIIVSGKISKLLQSIASSIPLCDYMQRQTEGYNFIDEFRARQFRDESGRPYLDVPANPEEQTKFAFCMLFAIDTGKLNIENLLHTFYNNPDANTELKLFCAEIVQPLAYNLNMAFNKANTVPDTVEPVNPLDTPPCEPQILPETEQSLPAYSEQFDQSLLDSINDVTSSIINYIANHNALQDLTREEILLVADAFADAVRLSEFKAIRVMYIALKLALINCPVFSEIENLYNDLTYLVSGLGIHVE